MAQAKRKVEKMDAASNPAGTSVEIQKVVATPVDIETLPTSPSAEIEPATVAVTEESYQRAIAEVRAAMAEYRKSVWRVAWALVDFQTIHETLYPHDRLTHKALAKQLSLDLSVPRIGQLINTAIAFPREKIDQAIEFRVYEDARLLTLKKPSMTADKRLELVKKHPTRAAIAKLKPKSDRKVVRELVIRAKIGEGKDGVTLTALLAGTPHTLPPELGELIQRHAADALG